MDTALLPSSLTYDFRHLTFHQITNIQIRNTMYIHQSLKVSHSYIAHILIVHVILYPYRLIFLVSLVALLLYSLRPVKIHWYLHRITLEELWYPHIIAFEDLGVPLYNSPCGYMGIFIRLPMKTNRYLNIVVISIFLWYHYLTFDSIQTDTHIQTLNIVWIDFTWKFDLQWVLSRTTIEKLNESNKIGIF